MSEKLMVLASRRNRLCGRSTKKPGARRNALSWESSGRSVRAGTSGSWQRLEACPRWELSLEDAEAQGIRPRRSGIQKLHLVGVAWSSRHCCRGRSDVGWRADELLRATTAGERGRPLPEPPPLIEVPRGLFRRPLHLLARESENKDANAERS